MDAESITPTHKRFGAPVDEMLDRHESADIDRASGVSGEICASLALLIDDPERRESVRDGIQQAMEILDHLVDSAESPEVRSDALNARVLLTSSIFTAANEIACQKIEQEMQIMPNLAQFKAAEARAEAVRRAGKLWGDDAEKDLKIGQAAKIIRHALDRDGFGLYVEDTVRSWIRCAAPSYATKGGRPKRK